MTFLSFSAINKDIPGKRTVFQALKYNVLFNNIFPLEKPTSTASEAC